MNEAPRVLLDPDWAFVVQLAKHTSFEPDQLCGRIEHVTSGKASEFASVDAARAFMKQVMTEGGAA